MATSYFEFIYLGLLGMERERPNVENECAETTWRDEIPREKSWGGVISREIVSDSIIFWLLNVTDFWLEIVGI